MSQSSLDLSESVERLPLRVFTEKAYLDYSMYVILDRALPRLGDGLKPVQRRILYALSELGLSAQAKHKKSARAVGDVLGKFHPHGDSACYEAMVLMAQPFAYRYPLIDGQGNWGSPDDPKSFAAMRYTEARLTPYANVLLRELEQGAVDWQANFDGSLQEPMLLPARLPNLLLNGCAGIAVGMATDIPPHNLREVVNACIQLLDDPNTSLEQLCEQLPGPDFPTAGEIITPRAELLALYRSGNGSVRQRACWEREQSDIVITALPYQVSGNKIMEQIAAQMQAKKLPWIEDLRDESDHENPTRLVIIPRSNRVDAERLMSHLFATTDLERSYRVNMNLIAMNGRPRVMDLRGLLVEWLAFRTATVRRRLDHRLKQVQARLCVLQGLLIAYLNLDAVIAIIRQAESPKAVLIAQLALDERQAEAILNLRLRALARLEEQQLRAEQADLIGECQRLETWLGSEIALHQLLRQELRSDADAYGDTRRAPLIQRPPAEALDETETATSELLTVVLSEKGWVRAGKGHDLDPRSLSYRAGDSFLDQVHLRSGDPAVFLDSAGRCYSLPAHSLPTARGQGEPLTGRLHPPSGAVFRAVLSSFNATWYLLASDAGYGFLAQITDLYSKNKSGKLLITLPEGAQVMQPLPITDPAQARLAAITSDGRLLVFSIASLPRLVRGKGNQMIQIAAERVAAREEWLSHLVVLPQAASLILTAGKRDFMLRPADLEHYQGERGRAGKELPRGFQRISAARAG